MNGPYCKYIAALLLFGSNGIVAAHIALNSYEIVLLRTMIGSLLLAAIFLLTRQKITFSRSKSDFGMIVLSGAAMGASWMFLYEAYAQIGVSIASLVYYCGPVIVMALSPFLFREKLTLDKLAGFAAVLCGIMLVNGQAMRMGGNVWGLFCGVMSAVMYAVMVICNKKAARVTGMENAALQLIASFLTVAVFAGVKTGYAFTVRPSDWGWILLLGLVNTGVGCYFYFSSIGRLPVQTVALCGYLEPLSAVLFSVLLLGETMLPLQILGAALIIGGAVLGECVSAKSRNSGAKGG
ncbi:MAG: DMT family transporter [Eubacteriales bacterium]|nr:DMT family transporter [Eubacteriales bacterium]